MLDPLPFLAHNRRLMSFACSPPTEQPSRGKSVEWRSRKAAAAVTKHLFLLSLASRASLAAFCARTVHFGQSRM